MIDQIAEANVSRRWSTKVAPYVSKANPITGSPRRQSLQTNESSYLYERIEGARTRQVGWKKGEMWRKEDEWQP